MAEISERVFRDLVLQSMDAATDEECWPTLLQSLAAACDGMGSLVAGCSFSRPEKGFLINGGLNPHINQLFVQRHQDNLWAQAVLALRPDDGAIDIAALVEPSAIRATEFYADVLDPQGIRTMTPLGLPLGSGFDTGGISIAFDGRDDGAPRAAVALLDLMAPYLRRAMAMNLRLRALSARSQGFAAAFDHLPCAALLLANDGRVLFANGRAEALLSEADGLLLIGGELAASQAGDSRALRRLVGEACRAAEGVIPRGPDAVAVSRPSGKPPVSVLAAPVRDPQAGWPSRDLPVAMLIVTDMQEEPGTLPRATVRLRALFGLTPAEAVVAVQIAKGHSGPEAATALGVGPGTVHAHLKAVFAKTGVRRQSGLARLLTRIGVLDLD